MNNSVALGTFSVLCDHRLFLAPKRSHHPPKHPASLTPSLLPWRPLLFVHGFAYSDASCGWNHTLCLPLSLRIFEVHTWVRAEHRPAHACILQASTSMSHGSPEVGQGGHSPRLACLLWACPLFFSVLLASTTRGHQVSSYLLPGAGSRVGSC